MTPFLSTAKNAFGILGFLDFAIFDFWDFCFDFLF